MSNELQALASQTGLNLEMVQKGIGALLAFLKEKLGDDAAGSLMEAIPNAGELLQGFQASGTQGAGSAAGGVLGSLTEMAGKLLGGQAEDASDLVQKLTGTGFSMDQILAFLPKILEFLQSKLPPELLGRILEQLPNIPGLNLPDLTTRPGS